MDDQIANIKVVEKVEPTYSLAQKGLSEIKLLDDKYWNKILTDDLTQLFSNPQIGGFKRPPTLKELEMHSLNERLFVGNIAKLNSLADQIRKGNSDDGKSENFKFKQLCFLFLRYSKYSQLVEIGASNAITILNYARTSFSLLDLSGIRIRAANLNQAILDSASLKNASLIEVTLQDAWLQETDFSFSTMKSVYFGEEPYFELSDAVRACCYGINEEEIIVASGNDLYIYDLKRNVFQHVLKGHTKLITTMTLSNSGQWIVSGSHDETIRLWLMISKKCEYILKVNKDISCLIFGINEKEIIWSDNNGNIFRIEIETMRLIQILEGHGKKLLALALSCDGKYFISGGEDKTARIWLTETGQCKYVRETDSTINCSTFNVKNDLVAVGCDSGIIFVWDLKRGNLVHKIYETTGPIMSLTFSPNNQWLIAGGSIDESIHLFSVETGRSEYIFDGYTGWVRSVNISPDGNYILSGSDDGTIHQWHFGSKIIYSNNNSDRGHTTWITSIAIDKTGKLVVSASLDNSVRLWDARSGQCIRHWKRTKYHANYLAFDPCGQWIVVGYSNGVVKIYSVINNEEKILKEVSSAQNIDDNAEEILCVAVSPDGQYIATGSADKKLYVWVVRTGKIKQIFEEFSIVACITFSPDNQYIVSGHADKNIRLRLLETGEVLNILEGDRNWVDSICFNSDGKYLVSGNGHIVRLWSLESGICENSWVVGNEGECVVKSVAYSFDDKWIIVGSWCESIQLISVESKKIVDNVFVGDVNSLVWVNNTELFFISGGKDKTIKCWQIIDTNQNPQIVLRWSTGKSILTARNACLDDVIELEKKEYNLLIQRGAFCHDRNTSRLSRIYSEKQLLLMVLNKQIYSKISFCFLNFLDDQVRKVLKNTNKSIMRLVRWIEWEEQQTTTDLQKIINLVREKTFIYHLILTDSFKFFVAEEKNKIVEFFLINDKKILLTLSENHKLMSFYFNQVSKKLWQQGSINFAIPLYIELTQLKNPFTHLMEEGLSLYGLCKEQGEVLLNSNHAFILILIGYDQLKTDRPRNLYVTNKLEKYNIQKIIITCHLDYITTKKNYQLYFTCYQNKEPQYDKLQEVDFGKVVLTSALKEVPKMNTIGDEYWHKILTDDLEQLFNEPQIGGYKQPPMLLDLEANPLNKRLLVDVPTELNTRADAIMQVDSEQRESENFKFKQLCFLFLRYSKYSHLLEVGAANAITILNYARISFSGMNLSDIKVPGANLAGAIFDHAKLTRSNLYKVILKDAYLKRTDFSNSIMTDVKFSEHPSIKSSRNPFICICYNTEGNLLFTLTSDYSIYIWDIPTRKILHELIDYSEKNQENFFWNPFGYKMISYNSTKNILAAVGCNNSVQLWSLNDNKKTQLLKHTAQIYVVCFNADGNVLATGGEDKTICIWQITSLDNIKLTKSLKRDGYITSIDFHVDNKFMACGGWDNIIQLWRIGDWDGIFLEINCPAYVTDVAFSHKTNILVSGCWNYNLYIWELDDNASSNLLRILVGHNHLLTSVCFNSDSSLLASGSWDGTVRIWNLSTEKNLLKLLNLLPIKY